MNQWDIDVDLNEALVRVGIGTPTSSPTPIDGGLLHRMWRVETATGTCAVKVLNPEIMSRPAAKGNYRNSERVARIARSAGVDAVTARTAGEDPWLEANGWYVMVFDWVVGRTFRGQDCGIDQAATIGEVLQRIHGLRIALDDVQPSMWDGVPEDAWLANVDRGDSLVACWGVDKASLLSDLLMWSRLYRDGSERLSKSMVMSHRDLDPKNVIWSQAGTPYLIDWESAGYVNPAVELMEVALNWSRTETGACDQARFQAVVQRYVRAGGVLSSDVSDALHGSLGGMLGWLEYNMRRSVDVAMFDDSERQLAQREVRQTIHHLRSFARDVLEYAQWCEAAIM